MIGELKAFADVQECLQKAMMPGTKDKGPFHALKSRFEATNPAT